MFWLFKLFEARTSLRQVGTKAKFALIVVLDTATIWIVFPDTAGAITLPFHSIDFLPAFKGAEVHKSRFILLVI